MSSATLEKPAPREPKVEFTNDAEAFTHAASAIGLMARAASKRKESYAADIAACFELQSVADLVGPASNTHVRGITWVTQDGRFGYSLRGAFNDGYDSGYLITKASTEVEAREPRYLDAAKDALARLVEKNGGWAKAYRPAGTSAALLTAISETPAGRTWLSGRKKPAEVLRRMVSVADAYGANGMNKSASLAAHHCFISDPDRVRLIREYPNYESAYRVSRQRREGHIEQGARARVPVRTRETLMDRAGLSPEAAQAVLSLLVNKETSVAALARAVKALPTLLREMNAYG